MVDDENELDREIRNLSEQLTDEKVDAIARRLGLRPDEQPKRSDEAVNCSFCGKASSEVGSMVTNGAGAHICRKCLAAFSQG